MRSLIVSTCFIIALNLACKKDDSVVNPGSYSGDIIPLAVGNQWTYNVYLYDSTGASRLLNTMSFEVFGDTMVNRVRWFRFSEFLCANRGDGLHSLDTSGQPLIFKFPTFAQDSFFVNDVVGYLRIAAIDTLITISLGTYRCYAYESRALISPGAFGGSREIIYVSPGTGPIRGEVYVSPRIGERQFLWVAAELTSVTLK